MICPKLRAAVSVRLKAEGYPEEVARVSSDIAWVTLHEVRNQGWLCHQPSPMTITVLKRALDLSPNVLSDPHGSGPADAARAWLESLSEPA